MTFGKTDGVPDGIGIGTTDDDDAVEEEDDAALALIDEIIQVFDDFLWENNAKLDNKEMPEYDWVDQNMIYGQQRDDLTCRIFERLQEWGVV